MALVLTNLKKVAGASGFNLWVYDTADSATDVDSAGYFNGASAVMNIGDVILRRTFSSAAFTAILTVGFHFVNANASGVVDIADTLAITATDTD